MASYGPTEYSALCRWMFFHGGQIPDNVVPGGDDKGGEVAYVGRAVHSGDVLPGKVIRSRGLCYVPYGGKEFEYTNYQAGSDGSVPSGALPGGKAASGEQLYIGRARHEGMLIPGKVHPSIKCAFIPYEGKEYRYAEYEVLVSKTISFREAKERRD